MNFNPIFQLQKRNEKPAFMESLAKLAGSDVPFLYQTDQIVEENAGVLDEGNGPREVTIALKNRRFVVGSPGLEPGTYGLKVRSSTD